MGARLLIGRSVWILRLQLFERLCEFSCGRPEQSERTGILLIHSFALQFLFDLRSLFPQIGKMSVDKEARIAVFLQMLQQSLTL